MATLVIEGKVRLDQKEACSDELPLRAFAFDGPRPRVGRMRMCSAEGAFAIASEPQGTAERRGCWRPARRRSGHRARGAPAVAAVHGQRLGEARRRLPPEPRVRTSPSSCVVALVADARVRARRVRKTQPVGGPCPVPFVTVEVFDVDREACLWPILRPRLPILSDRRSASCRTGTAAAHSSSHRTCQWRHRRQTATGGLESSAAAPGPMRSRPGRPELNGGRTEPTAHSAGLRPASSTRSPSQPALAWRVRARFAVRRNGATPRVDRFATQNLTSRSRVEPWLLWPRCFYSKAKVCETTTDCDGRFTCCSCGGRSTCATDACGSTGGPTSSSRSRRPLVPCRA